LHKNTVVPHHCAQADQSNRSISCIEHTARVIMIIEFAQLTIRPGSEREFEAVFLTAIKVLGGSPGYLSHELRRSVENPNRYALIVQWQTLEDHTVGFRGSPAFTQWRALVGPYFESPPAVEHFAAVAGGD
jgi:heme-degrading monooxygenase HmoA